MSHINKYSPPKVTRSFLTWGNNLTPGPSPGRSFFASRGEQDSLQPTQVGFAIPDRGFIPVYQGDFVSKGIKGRIIEDGLGDTISERLLTHLSSIRRCLGCGA